MKILLVCTFVLMIGLTSCSKAGIRQNKVSPVMELVYPKDRPVLKAGQPLCIKIIITDDEQISSVNWSIRQDESRENYFHTSLDGNNTRNFVFDEKFIIPDHLNGDQSVLIKASDQCGNLSSLKIPFEVNN